MTAQDLLAPGAHPMTHISAWDGTEQPYNLFIPTSHTGNRPCPLIIALHGRAATWRSWFDLTTICEVAEREGWLVAAPQGRGDLFYLGAGEQDVLEVFAEVKRLCHVDEDRVFLTGHSMGGWGTWSFACSHPDLFAGIAPMSGWAPLERLENLDHLAPIIFHGTDDIPVPVQHSRDAATRLSAVGVEHRYVECPGVGHESKLISDALPQVADWIRERRRIEKPHHIRIRAWTAPRGSNRWLAILETRDRKRLAALDATVQESGEIRITSENVNRFRLEPRRMPLGSANQCTLIIGGQTIPIIDISHQRFLVATLCEEQWRVEGANVAQPTPSPIAARFTQGCDDLAVWMGGIVARHLGADATLLHRNHVQPSVLPGDLTTDELFDLHLRPGDPLCMAEVSQQRLTEIAKADCLPEWWGEAVISPTPADSDEDRTIRLVCIEHLARLLNLDAAPLNLSVSQVLLDAAEKTGGLK